MAKKIPRITDPNKNPIRRLTPNECRKLQGFLQIGNKWFQIAKLISNLVML